MTVTAELRTRRGDPKWKRGNLGAQIKWNKKNVGCADISISAHHKSSLEILRKNLFPLENADNVNIKTFGWAVFYGTALPRNETRQGVLPHPALPRPELTPCPAVVFSLNFRHRTKIHSACQNTELFTPPFFRPLLKIQLGYSHPPSQPTTTLSCAMWEHPHDSPPCPMCSKEFCPLGSKQNWPGTAELLARRFS